MRWVLAAVAVLGVGLAACGGGGGPGASPSPSASATAEVTRSPTPTATPAPVSAHKLSYVVGKELYVVNADGSGKRLMDGTGACHGAFGLWWSPDAARLACWTRSGLSLLDAGGGLLGSWSVTMKNPSVAWAPDSRHFTHEGDEAMAIRDRDGGLVAMLRSGWPPAGVSVARRSALWAPDGTTLAYWNEDASEMRVYSIATGTEWSYPGDFRPLAWLADGRTVLTALGYTPPVEFQAFPYEFHRLDVETGGTTRVPELETATDPRISVNPQLWFSADTSRVATLVWGDNGYPGLAVFDMGTRQLTVIPESTITYGSEYIPLQNVYWSGDGAALYWVDLPDGSTVYRTQANGTGLERVGDFPYFARLSPDLTAAAFVEYDGALTGTLRIDSVRGGARVEIASRPGSGGGSSAIPFEWVPLGDGRTARIDCVGSVKGRLVLGYGDGGPAEGEWIQIAGMPGDPMGNLKLTRTAADGGFEVQGVPAGFHRGFARHAQFEFTIERCGQVIDLGDVKYPLIHPDTSPGPKP